MPGLQATFPGRGVLLNTSLRSASNPAKYLPISSSLQEGSSDKPDLPLKVSVSVFDRFGLVLWVITDNNSAGGNLITWASLLHFVQVKSTFISLWIQLMLTKPGAIRNHTSFPDPLPQPWVRKSPLLFVTKCHVDMHAPGRVQKSPLCHLIEIYILICPWHSPVLSLLTFPIQFLTLKIILVVNWLISTIWVKGCKSMLGKLSPTPANKFYSQALLRSLPYF